MSDKDKQQAWHDHSLSQLNYFRSLSLRAKLKAVEGMADVVRRFQQLRAQGKIRKVVPVVQESSNEYQNHSQDNQ